MFFALWLNAYTFCVIYNWNIIAKSFQKKTNFLIHNSHFLPTVAHLFFAVDLAVSISRFYQTQSWLSTFTLTWCHLFSTFPSADSAKNFNCIPSWQMLYVAWWHLQCAAIFTNIGAAIAVAADAVSSSYTISWTYTEMSSPPRVRRKNDTF